MRRERIGLVFGAGGVLGAAWMAGTLAALEERIGRPLEQADLIVGTSAGSVIAAALRCGTSIQELVAHQRGDGPSEMPDSGDLDRDSGGGRPPMPRLRLGSPKLVLAGALAPHRVAPWVAATGWLPEGRARLSALGALVDGLSVRAADRERDPAYDGWTQTAPTWVMAVDYDSGRRVAFGRQGAPGATLSEAVVASCSIPGWFEPKVIGGRRYIDGGVRSSTSLDLLARARLDEIFVLAPMASVQLDRPHHPVAYTERRFRRVITAALGREAKLVRSAGTAVTIITPGPADLAAMGGNLMNPARRASVVDTSLQSSPAAVRRAADTGQAA